MDVTRDSFESAMRMLESLLGSDEVEFVSFDEEMSGINFAADGLNTNNWQDTCVERYESMRRVASAFGIVQLGVTVWLRKRGHVIAAPFNIFVFPSAEDGEDLLLSPGAVEFLNRNNMDWSTWLSKGVPFTAIDSDLLTEEPIGGAEYPFWLRRDEEKEFVDTELRKIRKVFNDSGALSYETAASPSGAAAKFVCERIRLEFEGKLRTEWNVGHRLNVVPLTKREKKDLDDEKKQEANRRKGARRVFLAISEACISKNIPLVGHNCYFDLLFLMRHFEGHLPESYVDFKKAVHKRFPLIYDTKVLASKKSFAKTTLEAIYDSMLADGTLQKMKVSFDERCPKYANDIFQVATLKKEEDGEIEDDKVASYHEAGWDSFVTGLVFMGLEKNKDENRLYLIRSHAAIDLTTTVPAEPPLHLPKGSLYVLRGPVAREAVARLFPNTTIIHRISYFGTDAFIVDIEHLPSNLTLPTSLRLLTWAQDSTNLLRREEEELLRTTKPPPPQKRLFSWIFPSTWLGNKKNTADNNKADDSSSSRPRKRIRSVAPSS